MEVLGLFLRSLSPKTFQTFWKKRGKLSKRVNNIIQEVLDIFSKAHTATYNCEIALTIVGVPCEKFIWFFFTTSLPQNHTKIEVFLF